MVQNSAKMPIPDAPDEDYRGEHAETAGRHLVSRVPTAGIHASVGEARATLAGGAFDAADALYLLSADGRLKGIVPLTRLLAEREDRPLREIATVPAPSVLAGADQEHVASLAIHHALTAVPVVDANERLLGVVPALAIIDVLRHEHVEDLHRIAGIAREGRLARRAIEAPPTRRARDRLPWLLAGLAGSALATAIVAGFEASLQAKVAIAFFIPGIVYLADAVGTQSEAIAVRGLSLSRMPLSRVIGGEFRTGLLIGTTLGVVTFIGIWLWLGDVRLGLAVAIALVAASTAATSIGFALPWLLARLGRDPAFGSGPLATIIQDVLSIVIYFATVSLLLF
ncbi:MAG: magnesium transporter [Burkholderiales bacterium]|jgi:magnesium transporter|nr:magnesium transporter [Burkholderiales bacterium]